MNTYSITDEEYKNSSNYQNFIKENPSQGFLKIRAFAAGQAIPIKGLEVTVSKIINNDQVIFFKGNTNESGVIARIALPAPKLNSNDLDIPNKITYDITTTYNPGNIKGEYKVNIYENVCVVQNINIVPDIGPRIEEI